MPNSFFRKVYICFTQVSGGIGPGYLCRLPTGGQPVKVSPSVRAPVTFLVNAAVPKPLAIATSNFADAYSEARETLDKKCNPCALGQREVCTRL